MSVMRSESTNLDRQSIAISATSCGVPLVYFFQMCSKDHYIYEVPLFVCAPVISSKFVGPESKYGDALGKNLSPDFNEWC